MAGTAQKQKGRSYRSDNRISAGSRNGRNTSAKTRNVSASRRKSRQKDAGLRDYNLIFVVFFLLAFGLVMLYSTSSYNAALSKATNYDPAFYLKKQLFASSLGLVVMAIAAIFPDYRLWKRLGFAVYIVATVLLILIIPFGTEANGAKRWIYIGPLSIQPAEVSKIAVIMVTAALIDMWKKSEIQKFLGMLFVMTPSLIQAVMIYGITRNLSSAIIVVLIAACMLFVATNGYWRYILIILLGLAVVAALVFNIWRTNEKNIANAQNASVATEESSGESLSFRGERVLAWLDPEKYADGKGFQTLQALYGIGSGGIIGKGLGESMQKLGYIPEAQNDMIFSIICEELGICGALAIIAMFVILCWRLMIIAINAEDLYGALLTVGVMSHIAIQVILNISVVTNVIPNTGVSLPFISYGGTSVLFLLAEIGLAMNVSRRIQLKTL